MFIKKILILFPILLLGFEVNAQETKNNFTVDANFFRGNVMVHDNSMLHLATGQPTGLILSWNKFTDGTEPWQARFNYPDYGVSLVYQDFRNEILGYNASINGHYNFYFLNRHLMLRLGQGIGWASNPFDRETNSKNIAISTRLTSSTFFMLNYKTKRLLSRFGFQAGLIFTHNSIGNIKSPNKGVNTVALNMGLSYDFSDKNRVFKPLDTEIELSKKINYNFVLRGGVNESDILGSGQFPFFVFSAYAGKRLSHKSGVQFGTDFFLSYFLKEYIKYDSIISEGETDANTDFKRASLFVGHELFINKMSIISQVGYYVYYPYDFAERYYFRIGLNYYFSKKFFAALTLKSHAADAEAIEFGIGFKL